MSAIVELNISERDHGAKDALDSSVCAIGVFDGVHRGHRYLIDAMTAEARSMGAKAAIITFDKDPDEVLNPGKIKKLMTNERRIAALADLDVDTVIVLRFDETLASMAPHDFLDAIFGDAVPAAVYVGEDFRFGDHARGDLATICAWAEGIEEATGNAPYLCAVELMEEDGEPITSTRIRALLETARLEEALALLGHPYTMSGPIVHGRGQGTGFGIATADLQIPDDCMVAADGVYAAWATLGRAGEAAADPTRYKAAISIGIPPTFADEAKANVEAHLLDFEGDIYGERLTLDIRHYLRPMIKFEDTEELVAAITADIEKTRELLA